LQPEVQDFTTVVEAWRAWIGTVPGLQDAIMIAKGWLDRPCNRAQELMLAELKTLVISSEHVNLPKGNRGDLTPRSQKQNSSPIPTRARQRGRKLTLA